MRAIVSSTSSTRSCTKRCSLNDPIGPPSALAPLSLMTMTSVSSSSPVAREVVEHPPDLSVGVAEEPGEHLHHPGVQPAPVGRQGVPVGDPGRAAR